MFQIFGSTYEVSKTNLEKTAKTVFSYLEDEFEVNLSFVSKEKIAELNKAYRNKESITDVLSFKLDDAQNGGDIVISYQVLKDQAKGLNLNLDEEASFLLVHGMLHLAGYDHLEASERATMEKTEDEILTQLGIEINR